MAVNLSDLPLEPIGAVEVDFDNYQDPQEFGAPVREGNVRLKTTQAEISKFDTKTGIMLILYSHEAYDPSSGEKLGVVNFDRVSTKVFPREGIPASMAADQLRATTGARSSRDDRWGPQRWGSELLAVKNWCDQGNLWDAVIKWEGSCIHKDTSFQTVMDADNKPLAMQPEGHKAKVQLKGARSWPMEGVNGNEHRALEVPCSVCQQPIRAQAKIDRRIPKS